MYSSQGGHYQRRWVTPCGHTRADRSVCKSRQFCGAGLLVCPALSAERNQLYVFDFAVLCEAPHADVTAKQDTVRVPVQGRIGACITDLAGTGANCERRTHARWASQRPLCCTSTWPAYFFVPMHSPNASAAKHPGVSLHSSRSLRHSSNCSCVARPNFVAATTTAGAWNQSNTN